MIDNIMKIILALIAILGGGGGLFSYLSSKKETSVKEKTNFLEGYKSLTDKLEARIDKQDKKIEAQEQEIDELRQENSELKKKVNKLELQMQQ